MNPSGWVTQACDMTTESKKKGPVDLWRAPRRRKLFRGRKGLSKYARWAQDLTEEHFLGLLEAVGEYGCRADKPLEILQRHAPKDNAPFARAMAALQILAEFTAGRPSTEEQLGRRVRKAVSDAERLMYRNNICARRWRLHDLEEFRRHAGGQVLFEVLFSGFTQDPPLSRGTQQILGGYLRKLKPRGAQRLASLVRASLKGWNCSVQQLPLYFLEVYGVEALRLALDRLDLNASLSVRERKALQSYRRRMSHPSACLLSPHPPNCQT